MLRREFLKLSITSLLAFRLFAPAPVRAQQPGPQPKEEAQAWGFPLTFPAYFLESEPEPEPLRTPTYKYYLNIRKNG